MGDISKFNFNNKLLPEAARFMMTPQSGFKYSFIAISEDGLIGPLGASDDVKNHLSDMFELEKGSKFRRTFC